MKKMLIDSNQQDETRMAVVENDKLIEYESENLNLKPTKGNIYLAKIIRVEPSLQAAFVDYGFKKHGFLAYTEIHPDYFKIPTADRDDILAEEDDENEFVEDELSEINESSILTNTNKNSFLDKVINFFNFKPIDENFISRANKKISPYETKQKPKKSFMSFHRKYSIQEVIKKNQVILVQVVKEERGNKGAAVTTRLSLAGKYCVLMPNTSKGGGISRKINDLTLRKDLKDTLNFLKIKKGMGVIIRTAGQNMGKKDISRDYKALLKLWSQITQKTIKSNAPCLIHEEGDLLKRVVRDYFTNNFSEILINCSKTVKTSKEIMKFFMPGSTKLVKLSNEKNGSIFASKKIEHQILEMHKPTVQLKSGGYLVINQTEALVAIDVNSGKSTKQRNIEDTATKTNLEAAEEISQQLILRDLAGLIVIDFIDMLERNNNFRVERKLKECIKNDRARIQCGRISNFGLLEMSRQRLKQNINTNISVKCAHCNNLSASPIYSSNQILRVCEEKLININYNFLNVFVSLEVAKKIKYDGKEKIKDLIKKYKVKINIIDTLDLNNLDCVIAHKKEIIYNNCNDEEKTSNILIKLDSMSSNINKKTSLIEKSRENLSNIENIITTNKKLKDTSDKIEEKKSRESYRAKAENFAKKSTNKKNMKVKNKSKNLKKNKQFEITEIQQVVDKKIISEKRQGWWNQ